MELVIQQGEINENVAFTVKVDTEARLKEGDIMCGYVLEQPNFQDKTAPPKKPAYWYLAEVKSKDLGNFFTVVDKHYKVIEIIKE